MKNAMACLLCVCPIGIAVVHSFPGAKSNNKRKGRLVEVAGIGDRASWPLPAGWLNLNPPIRWVCRYKMPRVLDVGCWMGSHAHTTPIVCASLGHKPAGGGPQAAGDPPEPGY